MGPEAVPAGTRCECKEPYAGKTCHVTCPMFQGKICGGNGECFIKTTGICQSAFASAMLASLVQTARARAHVMKRRSRLVPTKTQLQAMSALDMALATSTQLNGLNAPATRAGSPTTVLSAYAELRRASSTRRQRNAPALLVRCAVSVRQCAWLK